MYDILQLNDMLVPELREIAQNMGINSVSRLAKQDLIYKILDHQAVDEVKNGGAHVKENGTNGEQKDSSRRSYQKRSGDGGSNRKENASRSNASNDPSRRSANDGDDRR